MKTLIVPIGLLVSCAIFWAEAHGQAASAPEGLTSGVVKVFFDKANFSKPKDSAVQKQIIMDVQGSSYAFLWMGQIRFPESARITFSAEADGGVRLFIGNQGVIDGWAPDGAREGKIDVKAGQTLPLRVEYFHSGGEAHCRVFWQWEGHPREMVPPPVFWHAEKDLKAAQTIVEGNISVVPGNLPPVVSCPSGDEAVNSSIYRPGSGRTARGEEPIRLGPGPHLLVDDYLVASSKNVTRRVNRPKRDPKIPNPIITGKEGRCMAPYMTVIRDPETGRFRIWYNIWAKPGQAYPAGTATMESEDGIHWVRPVKIIEEPGPMHFGVAIIDEGPDFPERARRYKNGWFGDGGLMISTSADGLDWKMFVPHTLIRHNHDINNIFYDPLRKRYVATISVFTAGPTWKKPGRTTMQSASKDLVHWEKPWYAVTANDELDEGHTQFYAMNGYLFRGELCIGLVKILRDDLVAPGTPKGAYGVGYTELAWSRDGEHWVRDIEPFFEPDPEVDAWDHAHAWMDFQLPVGDEVYIYYGGYKYGHKMDRFEGRQIGLVRMARDRYVSRDAGPAGGTLLTPPVVLGGGKMTVNAEVNGELRVRLLDASGKPIPGFDADDCMPVKGDSLAHVIQWKGSPATLPRKPLRMEFLLRDARLYGFELNP